MDSKALKLMTVSVLVVGLMIGRAYADNNFAKTKTDETAALKAEVQALNERITQLEKQLVQKQAVTTVTTTTGSTTAGTTAAGAAVPVQTMDAQWDPWAEMDMMQTAAMNRMAAMTPMLNFYSPRTDIQESPQQYLITMDIPGMTKDQINVRTEGRNIIVSGERSSERERNEPGQTYAHERSFGKFIRSIPLPEDAATDSIDAQYNNGVLTIKVARTGKGKGTAQKVAVK